VGAATATSTRATMTAAPCPALRPWSPRAGSWLSTQAGGILSMPVSGTVQNSGTAPGASEPAHSDAVSRSLS
jgi:hypothetical protein